MGDGRMGDGGYGMRGGIEGWGMVGMGEGGRLVGMKGMSGDVNTSTLLIYSAVRISNCRTGTRKKKVVLIIFLVGGVIAGVKECTLYRYVSSSC